MKIAIVNGPNLNLLGSREPSIYGNTTFEDYFKQLRLQYLNIDFSYYQSNVEGELINQLQYFGHVGHGIILNPGGYTHTSVAIGDCIAAISSPVVEVHISNIQKREDFRKISHVSAMCKGSIVGLGLKGYELALQWLISYYQQ